jgi:hypothetical protein
VNDSTAIAAVDHGCDVISQGDYIEPFTAPVVLRMSNATDRRAIPISRRSAVSSRVSRIGRAPVPAATC